MAKIVKTLKFPNSTDEYQINAVALQGKTLDEIRAEFPKVPDAALTFVGITTTNVTDGSTTNPVTVGGKSVTVATGGVVLRETSGDTVPDKEFVWDGSKWIELGDGASHALKSTAIAAGAGLNGTLKLDGTGTFSHPTHTATTVNKFINSIEVNTYGHVTSVNGVDTISTDALHGGSEIWYFDCGTATRTI